MTESSSSPVRRGVSVLQKSVEWVGVVDTFVSETWYTFKFEVSQLRESSEVAYCAISDRTAGKFKAAQGRGQSSQIVS